MYRLALALMLIGFTGYAEAGRRPVRRVVCRVVQVVPLRTCQNPKCSCVNCNCVDCCCDRQPIRNAVGVVASVVTFPVRAVCAGGCCK